MFQNVWKPCSEGVFWHVAKSCYNFKNNLAPEDLTNYSPPWVFIERKCALYTYICTYLFMLCYVCHLPELWKRGMAWLEAWKGGMGLAWAWGMGLRMGWAWGMGKRGMAGLEAWEGGMARTKQWKKEVLGRAWKNIQKNLPKNAGGIFWKIFFEIFVKSYRVSLLSIV